MEFIRVARLHEVPTGALRRFAADGVRVVLTRVGAEIYALQDACPHRGCDWDGAAVEGELITCPRCRFRYSARTGLNPLTTACHVNQSTAAYHYRHFPEGHADVYDVRRADDEVAVSTVPRPFRKVIV